LWFTTRVIEPGQRNSGVGDDAGDAVVRPLSRAARRPCARPGCPSPAHASLVFSYRTREAWLDHLGEPSPQAYDLCAPHATRTTPPRGWQLRDRRPADERATEDDGPAGPAPAPLGGEHTIAVLAAALRAVPDLPAASDPSTPLDEPSTVTEDDPSPVLGHGAALPGGPSDEGPDAAPDPEPSAKPILAARPRLPFPPAPGSRAEDW
jgi:hypothetical protein